MPCCQNHLQKLTPPLISRRQMLKHAGFGFGAWALLDLLARDKAIASLAPAAAPAMNNPLAAKMSHFPAKAKHVIFLFMQGGPSHLDTFDPKPALDRLHGQPLPPSLTKGLHLQFTHMNSRVLRCPLTLKKSGQSGLEIAENYPNLQQCADDLAVVRSCYHDSFNHAPAQYMMSTGSSRMGRPSVGSWVT